MASSPDGGTAWTGFGDYMESLGAKMSGGGDSADFEAMLGRAMRAENEKREETAGRHLPAALRRPAEHASEENVPNPADRGRSSAIVVQIPSSPNDPTLSRSEKAQSTTDSSMDGKEASHETGSTFLQSGTEVWSDRSFGPDEGTPKDFVGSIDFWKTWNQRRKKNCEEPGECTCFEGIGSVF